MDGCSSRTSWETATARCSRPGVVQDPRRSPSWASGALCSRTSISGPVRQDPPRGRINYYPPGGQQGGLGQQSTSSGGWATDAASKWTSSAVTPSWPLPSSSTWRSSVDLASRPGMSGIQEWLSFYFKSPMTAAGLYPEHDIFIQLMKLQEHAQHLRGEDLITTSASSIRLGCRARGRDSAEGSGDAGRGVPQRSVVRFGLWARLPRFHPPGTVQRRRTRWRVS